MISKLKRGLIFIFILSFAIGASALYAFAYEPYISSGEVRTKTIKFSDSAGEEVDSLTPGTVYVSAMVKSLTAGKKATLVVCVYEDNEMVSFNPVSQAISLPLNKALTLNTSVVVPENADTLRAFLWSDTDGLFPYAQTAVLSSGNINVKSISLDGLDISGFSNDKYEYTVSLNPGYMTYPETVVNTSDASCKVEITQQPFESDNPVSVIKVSNGTDEKTYTINYIKEAPTVTDAKINTDNIKNTTGVTISDTNLKVTTDILRDPQTDEPTLVWNNRSDISYQEFPDALIGATAVQVRRGLAGELPANYDYSSYGDMMEFKINRSAEVYVHIDNPSGFSWLGANGFSVSDVTIKRWNTDITLYKKVVYVEPGDTATISLGYVKGGTSEPTILVKFLDKLPEKELIENAKIFKTTDGSFISNADVLKNVQKYEFVDGTLTGTSLYAASNLTGAVKAFNKSYRNYYLHFSDMLSGSDYIKLGYNWNDVTGSSSVSYYCTFDITKTATVYVNMWNFAQNKDKLYEQNPWLSGYDWIEENGDFEVGYIKDGALQTKSFGFEKTFAVDPDDTVTITVGPFINPTSPTNSETFPMIFVKAE